MSVYLPLKFHPAALGFCAALLLSACGGGSGGTTSGISSTDSSAAASGATSADTTSVQSGTLALSNLPTAKTLSTSASIAYQSSVAGTTYCKLDSYSPIVCPNPFVLGATSDQALSVGQHTVDFYIDTGSGFDVANPTSSYTWTVVAAAASGTTTSTGTTSAATTTTSTAATTASSGAAPILLAGVNASQSFASMGGNNYVQLLGGQTSLSAVPESGGLSGSGTITGPSTVGSSTMRFGKITDPLNSSRTVFYHAAKASDPVTYGHLGRVEIGLDAVAGALQKTGVTYWAASEIYIPASRIDNGGDGTIIQVHNSYPPSTVTGPWLLGMNPGAIFPNRGLYFERIWSTQSNPGLSGYNINQTYPFASDNASWPATAATDYIAQNWPSLMSGLTSAAWPRDQWVKVVVKYRGDPTGDTGILQVWTTTNGVTTQIVNETNVQLGTNDAPAGYPTDYIKSGLDDLTGGGANGVWELRRSVYLFQDNGNTEPQIRALMQ